VSVRLSTASDERPRKRLSASERRELIERAASEVFSERGYRAATIDEIARRSGVSAPVVYDHFDSKLDLHRRLLKRYYGELRGVWRENLAGEEPGDVRIARSFDAWFGYLQAHPYAWRMLFADTTGDREIEALHRAVAAESRDAIIDLLAREGATSPSAAAARLEVRQPTVTGWLNALREGGLLERDAVAGDGRRASLALSARGRALHGDAADLVRRRQARVLAVLDPSAQGDLLVALRRVSAAPEEAAEGSARG